MACGSLTDLQRGYCLCLEPLSFGALLESERLSVSPAKCLDCLATMVAWPLEDELEQRRMRAEKVERCKRMNELKRERRLKAA